MYFEASEELLSLFDFFTPAWGDGSYRSQYVEGGEQRWDDMLGTAYVEVRTPSEVLFAYIVNEDKICIVYEKHFAFIGRKTIVLSKEAFDNILDGAKSSQEYFKGENLDAFFKLVQEAAGND